MSSYFDSVNAGHMDLARGVTDIHATSVEQPTVQPSAPVSSEANAGSLGNRSIEQISLAADADISELDGMSVAELAQEPKDGEVQNGEHGGMIVTTVKTRTAGDKALAVLACIWKYTLGGLWKYTIGAIINWCCTSATPEQIAKKEKAAEVAADLKITQKAQKELNEARKAYYDAVISLHQNPARDPDGQLANIMNFRLRYINKVIEVNGLDSEYSDLSEKEFDLEKAISGELAQVFDDKYMAVAQCKDSPHHVPLADVRKSAGNKFISARKFLRQKTETGRISRTPAFHEFVELKDFLNRVLTKNQKNKIREADKRIKNAVEREAQVLVSVSSSMDVVKMATEESRRALQSHSLGDSQVAREEFTSLQSRATAEAIFSKRNEGRASTDQDRERAVLYEMVELRDKVENNNFNDSDLNLLITSRKDLEERVRLLKESINATEKAKCDVAPKGVLNIRTGNIRNGERLLEARDGIIERITERTAPVAEALSTFDKLLSVYKKQLKKIEGELSELKSKIKKNKATLHKKAEEMLALLKSRFPSIAERLETTVWD